VGALAGPFAAAAVLLGVAGVLELRRPAATVGALRAMGLPASPVAVRLGACVALVVSVGAIATAGRLFASLVALAYLGFSAFVAAAFTRGTPLASCGCFGRDDTPATVGHLVIDLGAVAIAALVAVGPGDRGWDAAGLGARSPMVVALFVVLTACTTAFAYLALTALPRLIPARPNR